MMPVNDPIRTAEFPNFKLRLKHLIKERNTEIKNTSITVYYISKPSPRFAIRDRDYHAINIQDLFSSMISPFFQVLYLNPDDNELCFLTTFSKSELVMKDRIILIKAEYYEIKRLEEQAEYKLCFGNATLNSHKKAMQQVINQSSGHNPYLLKFIDCSKIREIPPPNNPVLPIPMVFQNILPFLTSEQERNLLYKTMCNSLSFIKGPPGCGKTRIGALTALVHYWHGLRVIITAVSKQACLQITQRMFHLVCQFTNYLGSPFELNMVIYTAVNKKIDFITVPEELKPYTLRARALEILYSKYSSHLAKKRVEEAYDEHLSKIYSNKKRYTKQIPVGPNCSWGQFEIAINQAHSQVCKSADIVVCTATRAFISNQQFHRTPHQSRSFDTVVFDEATQASYAETLCALSNGCNRLILLGDDKQLGPTCISGDAINRQNFFTDSAHRQPLYFTLLREQRRMHPLLIEFSNLHFYDGQIFTSPEILALFAESPRSASELIFQGRPVKFISHPHRQLEEVLYCSDASKKQYSNKPEATIVKWIMQHLFKPQDQVWIMSPYLRQIALIEKELEQIDPNRYRITTIDGSQGTESEYVVLSLVRNNPKQQIGFLNDPQRMNVMLTRAKRGLIVIGNSETLRKDQHWGKYVAWAESKQLILTPEQFMDETQKRKAQFEEHLKNSREKSVEPKIQPN